MAHDHVNRDKDLAGLIFSWNLQDITNWDLYKSQVKEIPSSFSSLSQYLTAFRAPLIEEIRSGLCSNLYQISHTPIWSIVSYKRNQSTGSDPSYFIYTLKVRQLKGGNHSHDANYKLSSLRSGDVLALSTVRRPGMVGDLIRSNRPCTLALVVSSDEEEEGPVYTIEVRPSLPLAISFENGITENDPLYIIVLGNSLSSYRIWVSLNLDQERQIQCGLLKIALYNGSSAYNSCGCWSIHKGKISSTLISNLNEFNLNESQMGAVLSCLSGRKCTHRPGVKLIWGPPGTGKTKTVSILLWCLLAENIRTVTCAPTNVAVVQIAKRLMALIEEKVPSGCSSTGGVGDVLLFGSEDKMEIEDNENLKNIYLKHRVKELTKCFASLTGWNHQIAELRALLENCFTEYNRYVTMQKTVYNSRKVDKGKMNPSKTFREYIRERFVALSDLIKEHISIFCKNLPSHMMNKSISNICTGLNRHLTLICKGLCNSSISNFDLEEVFTSCVTVITANQFKLLVNKNQKYTFDLDGGKIDLTSMSFNETCDVWCDQSTKTFWEARVWCLRLVSALQRSLKVPENQTEQKIEAFCLTNATIVLCTVCGSFRLRSIPDMPPIELLIIDEAAQLKECETLIPMQIPGLRHAVLIGDECQLPAVIMSKICEKANFGRSLFERLVLLGHDKHLLNIQYRMHPCISVFPNSKFYNGQIIDGENVKLIGYQKQYLEDKAYGPFSFINVHSSGQEGSDVKGSKINMAEVEFVSFLVEKLFEAFKRSNKRTSVGVISPYNAQVYAISKKIRTRYENINEGEFSVNVKSVDGFQGGEEDIIIISTVRSNMNGDIGFLDNLQRTNVALTRAKHCLWILGDATTLLNSGSIWKDVVIDAKIRGCFFHSTTDGTMIEDAGHQIDELDNNIGYNTIDSSMFSNGKWKVFFTDDFRKSFVGIEESSVRREIIEFIRTLSNGFPMKINTKIEDGSCSSQKYLNLLKKKTIQGQCLFWTKEILKNHGLNYSTQVLNFWDTIPREEHPSAQFLGYNTKRGVCKDAKSVKEFGEHI